MIRRTFEAGELERVFNAPGVRSSFIGEGATDYAGVVAHPSAVALLAENGAFLLIERASRVYETHVGFLPCGRGAQALAAAREAIAWAWRELPVDLLTGMIRSENRRACRFVGLLGFTIAGRFPVVWPDGLVHLSSFYVLGRPA
jgi:hypothetical protein